METTEEMFERHVENLARPNLAELYTALSAAQGEITAAELTRENPHLKNRYATLAAVWDACRAPLAKNGLCLQQFPSFDGARVSVRTVLAHKSGQEIESTLTLAPQQLSIQGIGSAITYARRYSMSAMVGVCPDDDDDGATAGKPESPARGQNTVPPPPQQSTRTRAKKTEDPKSENPKSETTTAALPKDEGAEARKAFWSCVTSRDGILGNSGDLDKDATRAAVVRRLHALESSGKIPAEVPVDGTSEALQAWLASYQPAEVAAITDAYRRHAEAEQEAEESSASPAEAVVGDMFEGLPS